MLDNVTIRECTLTHNLYGIVNISMRPELGLDIHVPEYPLFYT
jgi:hypothetical protein